MTAYESRLRAWAKEGGFQDFMTAPIEQVEAFMREHGIMAEFYEAFPNYDPDGDGEEM